MSEYQDRAIAVWEWLIENPGKSKKRAYEALSLPKDSNDCPACQYVVDKYDDFDCRYCPIYSSWITYDGNGYVNECEHPDSAFSAWSFGNNPKYTEYVLESVRDWWDEDE